MSLYGRTAPTAQRHLKTFIIVNKSRSLCAVACVDRYIPRTSRRSTYALAHKLFVSEMLFFPPSIIIVSMFRRATQFAFVFFTDNTVHVALNEKKLVSSILIVFTEIRFKHSDQSADLVNVFNFENGDFGSQRNRLFIDAFKYIACVPTTLNSEN